MMTSNDDISRMIFSIGKRKGYGLERYKVIDRFAKEPIYEYFPTFVFVLYYKKELLSNKKYKRNLIKRVCKYQKRLKTVVELKPRYKE